MDLISLLKKLIPFKWNETIGDSGDIESDAPVREQWSIKKNSSFRTAKLPKALLAVKEVLLHLLFFTLNAIVVLVVPYQEFKVNLQHQDQFENRNITSDHKGLSFLLN